MKIKKGQKIIRWSKSDQRRSKTYKKGQKVINDDQKLSKNLKNVFLPLYDLCEHL